MNKIVFYGAAWCGNCRMSKTLLDKHNINYEYIDLEKDPTAAQKVEEINGGYQSIPTILFPNGKVLVEPSNEDLHAILKDLKLI